MRLISAQNGQLLTLDNAVQAGRRSTGSFTIGLEALDALIPGGLPRGAIHEVLSDPRHGLPLFFAALLAGAGCGTKVLVWCDPGGQVYPPALAEQNVPLDRLYLLHPPKPVDEVWAIEQCLRCPAVGAVVAQPPELSMIQARRLQLSAERGGTVGILLRRLGDNSVHYAAATRWLVAPMPGQPRRQRWSVRLIHGHGGQVNHGLILECCRATNHVRAIEQLADRPPAAKGIPRLSA